MGADGNIVVCKRIDFEAANPDVPPSWLSLYTGTILGIEAVWGYFGDNLDGPNYVQEGKWTTHPVDEEKCYEGGTFRDYTPEERERLLKAVRWFTKNAEVHEVWT